MAASRPSSAEPFSTSSAAGPGTVSLSALASLRPSGVHTAPFAAQSAVAGRLSVTAPWDRGLILSSHRSRRLFTRRARVTLAPSSRSVGSAFLAPAATGALNAMRTLKPFRPSCSAGAAATRAVSAPEVFPVSPGRWAEDPLLPVVVAEVENASSAGTST